MERELDTPQPDRAPPPGINVTSWTADSADRFFQAYDRSFRDRPGFPCWSRQEWEAWAYDESSRPAWSLLASRGDEPVGFLNASAATARVRLDLYDEPGTLLGSKEIALLPFDQQQLDRVFETVTSLPVKGRRGGDQGPRRRAGLRVRLGRR